MSPDGRNRSWFLGLPEAGLGSRFDTAAAVAVHLVSDAEPISELMG